MYLLLQVSLVQAQLHQNTIDINEDAIGKIMNSSAFAVKLLKPKISGCDIECPKAIHWSVCTEEVISKLMQCEGEGVKMINKVKSVPKCQNLPPSEYE